MRPQCNTSQVVVLNGQTISVMADKVKEMASGPCLTHTELCSWLTEHGVPTEKEGTIFFLRLTSTTKRMQEWRNRSPKVLKSHKFKPISKSRAHCRSDWFTKRKQRETPWQGYTVKILPVLPHSNLGLFT